MIFYRLQTERPGEEEAWTACWTRKLDQANTLGRALAPARVDRIEAHGKEELVKLLNLAHANREALAQEFHVELVKTWEAEKKAV